MTDFDRVGVASLQELREDLRAGRKVLTARQALALVDLALSAKEAVRVARAEAAAHQAVSLFDSPSPVRLPGDQHG